MKRSNSQMSLLKLLMIWCSSKFIGISEDDIQVAIRTLTLTDDELSDLYRFAAC